MTVITADQVASTASVFWSIGDNVLSSEMVRKPYTKERLRMLLTFDALLSERLCLPDLCLLNNRWLLELLMYDGYDVFLKNGILVPMLRPSAPSFTALEAGSRSDPTTYGLLEQPRLKPFAEFLDSQELVVLRTNESFREALTENFEEGLLNPDFQRATGIHPIARDIVSWIDKYRRGTGSRDLRRSTFFFLAEELRKNGHPLFASRLKLASSAIYNNTFLHGMDIRPEFPHTYSTAILGLIVPEKDRQLHKTLVDEEPFRDLSITANDLALLKPNDVIAIRGWPEARTYFEAARVARTERNADRAAAILTEGLASYLCKLNEEIASIRTGKQGRIGKEKLGVRLVRFTNFGATVGLGLVALHYSAAGPIAAWAAFGIGIVWALSTVAIDVLQGEKVSQTTRDIHHQNLQLVLLEQSQGKLRPIIDLVREDCPRF